MLHVSGGVIGRPENRSEGDAKMTTYHGRNGHKRQVEQAYIVVNRRTGEQYRPNSRGATAYRYPNRYAAEQAIAAMPPRWRDGYEAKPCSE
jgi:hypothetical protein